jgi:hypothetical protein
MKKIENDFVLKNVVQVKICKLKVKDFFFTRIKFWFNSVSNFGFKSKAICTKYA